MDLKKKSTLSKAFSRFRRKSASQPDSNSPPTAALESNSAEAAPSSQPAVAPSSEPAVAPSSEPPALPEKHITIDTKPTNLPAANDNGMSHLDDGHNIVTPPVSPLTSSMHPHVNTGMSHLSDSHNTVTPPISPLSSSMHPHENTAMSSESSTSNQVLSSTEGNNQEEGLNPADLLLSRLTAYRLVLKDLQKYFTEIVSIENGIAKAMHKASNTIVVPFKDGTQFMGKGGFQDVCIAIHNSTRVRGDQRASAARFVDETIVTSFRRLKKDIKAKIKNLKSDTNLYETRVYKEREATQERIGSLAKAIGLFENSGGHQLDMEKSHSDPYLLNLSLKRQLVKQVNEENLFARGLQQLQDQVMRFEKHIINEVKQILTSFAQYELGQSGTGFSQSWAPTEMALNVLQEDSEWTNFMERNHNRLFPSELVDANPEELDYPCKDSPFVSPIMSAHLSRQSSVLKNWKEGFFVLTLSGWLHVFASADFTKDSIPERSIYIPTATLGPHTEAGQKQHVFSLEGKGMGGLLHRESQTFTLRANSREEMLEWWNELSKRAHSSMVIQPGESQLSRSGSVKRSGSRASRTETPIAPNQEPIPGQSTQGEFENSQEMPGAEGVAPVAAATTAEGPINYGNEPVHAATSATANQAPSDVTPVANLGQAPVANAEQMPSANPVQVPAANAEQMPAGYPRQEPVANPEQMSTANPVQAPAPNPVQAPGPYPEQVPAANPVQAPAPNAEQVPAPNPGQAPAANPEQALAANPEQAPVTNPGQWPVANPEQVPVSNPGQWPVEDPEQAPVSKPALNSNGTGSTSSLNTRELPALPVH
ncbi:hypothetical protein BGZ80_000827 [Entomortierella chlamydospora]|uniref:PH domain-containing protein n=1 Tax=Entomortierella chlamydospora TaxID=101097 RepID=A0A9P6MRW3_9FUNG|nr:hypothetical protein BGZ80_000827 [Entomortierella chlamydospora]